MDQERFDTLTRTLAAGMSRRSVLRTLSAVGAGGVLAVVGRGTAEAGKCKKANRCGKGKHQTCCKDSETCDHGTCVPDSPDNRAVTLSFEFVRSVSHPLLGYGAGHWLRGGQLHRVRRQ